VCPHGFTDTWRTWELVLPELERRHEVLAPTLLGHAGGPPLDREVPHADWVVLEGIGHCPHLDIPLEAAQLIVGFTAGA
jgi:pimeloyl-ACP methyl ester carboxylesterase